MGLTKIKTYLKEVFLLRRVSCRESIRLLILLSQKTYCFMKYLEKLYSLLFHRKSSWSLQTTKTYSRGGNVSKKKARGTIVTMCRYVSISRWMSSVNKQSMLLIGIGITRVPFSGGWARMATKHRNLRVFT